MVRQITKYRSRSNVSGFTFIEVVVVIIILGILLSVATSNVDTALEVSRHQETQAELKALTNAIAGNPDLVSGGMRSDFGYVGDVGSLPGSLADLVTAPGGYTTWRGPYIRDDFTENVDDYSTDAWDAGYTYSGGVTVQSTGSGSTITAQIANSAPALLSTTVRGTVLDRNGAAPGDAWASVEATIIYPDGAGSTTSATVNPNRSGAFSFNGIPIGNHQIEVVYTTANDTVAALASVLPTVGGFIEALRFGAAHWTGSAGTSESFVIRPDGTGIITEHSSAGGCASNWECVDDVTADGATSYVEGSGVPWNADLYTADNSPVSSGVIDSLVIHIVCYGQNSSRKAQTLIRTGGATFTGVQENLSTSWTTFSTLYSANPNTTSPWTWTEIDALEIGVSIKSDGRCTQVWAEIFYTAP